MPRRNRNSATTAETFTIWTSFTDLMSNAFMIITLLLLFFVAKSSTETSPINPDPPKPVIISLPAEKYSFPSGSAILPQNLQDDISQKGEDGVILRTIEENIAKLEKSAKRVDVIEVIGHTDGQELGSLKCNKQKGGNLDQKLEDISRGDQSAAILCPGSNSDLGLMRALSVVKELQKAQKQKQSGSFKQLQFRAYSSAQLLLLNDQGFAGKNRDPDPKRRRIEIRFAQIGEYVTPGK